MFDFDVITGPGPLAALVAKETRPQMVQAAPTTRPNGSPPAVAGTGKDEGADDTGGAAAPRPRPPAE